MAEGHSEVTAEERERMNRATLDLIVRAGECVMSPGTLVILRKGLETKYDYRKYQETPSPDAMQFLTGIRIRVHPYLPDGYIFPPNVLDSTMTVESLIDHA